MNGLLFASRLVIVQSDRYIKAESWLLHIRISHDQTYFVQIFEKV